MSTESLRTEISSLTNEEIKIVLAAWKVHIANPEKSPEECVKIAIEEAHHYAIESNTDFDA